MTRFEFSDILRKELSGRVGHATVNENVSYYEKYIDGELKKGRSEQEIMEELGDPRLIAKTIVNTAGADSPEYMEENTKRNSGRSFGGKVFQVPGWMGILIILLVVLMLFKVFAVLAPFLLPLILIWIFIRHYRR